MAAHLPHLTVLVTPNAVLAQLSSLDATLALVAILFKSLQLTLVKTEALITELGAEPRLGGWHIEYGHPPSICAMYKRMYIMVVQGRLSRRCRQVQLREAAYRPRSTVRCYTTKASRSMSLHLCLLLPRFCDSGRRKHTLGTNAKRREFWL